MKCVVLLGFSTTGKSGAIKHFKQTVFSESVIAIDSDEEVSKKENFKHIYEVFRKHLDHSNKTTKPAIDVIEKHEKKFLQAQKLQGKPMLIAAGPFLPIREPEWSDFITRIKPVFFYLQKNAEDVLRDLLKRRDRHGQISEIANDDSFGCWDQNVTTTLSNGRWVLVPPHEALQNVQRHMRGMVAIYEKLASKTFTWEKRMRDDNEDKQLKDAICQELGLK
jgi:shikimate kinase